MKNIALILAGGIGERVGYEKPKQFIKIAGKTVIEHTIDIFEKNKNIDEVYIVVHPNYKDYLEELIKKNKYKKIVGIVNGGKTRRDSSRIGINSINASENDNILIHDSVRLFLDDRIIKDVIGALNHHCAVDVAIPSTDTVIIVDDNKIIDIPNRDKMWLGQTPQGFKYKIIKKAHELSEEDNFTTVTDDCKLVQHYKLCDIYVVKGDQTNIKITYPQDIYLADRIFQIKSKKIISKLSKEEILNKLKKLKGKKIVVIGGTSGIGKEITELSKKFGANVYATSRRTGVDITNYNSVKEFFNKIGKVDIIINTAGILYRSPITTQEIDKIKDQIEINLIGSFNVVKAGIDHIAGIRSIILFTSSSYTRGREFYSPYSASKAGIVNMVQALSDELNDYGIKINAISPERTKTPMRIKNFGYEPDETLLDPKTVAYTTLITALSEINGQIIDVRKKDEKYLNLIGIQ